MNDRCHLNTGQVYDSDAVATGDRLVPDGESGVDDHRAVVGRLLVPSDTHARSEARSHEMSGDLRIEPFEDVPEVGAKPGCRTDGLGDPERVS